MTATSPKFENLDRRDDIAFLEGFRGKIDKYLILGYAPTEIAESQEFDSYALRKMQRVSAREDLDSLRREISEMKPRAKRLLVQCNISSYIEEQSTRHSALGIMGIPTSARFHMLDLITENRSEHNIQKSTVLDAIDQAIGVLRHQPIPTVKMATDSKSLGENYVFISHSSQDQEVVAAIKGAFPDLEVVANFFEDKSPGGPPAKEIAKAVGRARALFVFFTYNTISGDTRDWIVFELGVAVTQDVPIHAWKIKGLGKESLPRLVDQVTTYREFEPTTQGLFALTHEVRSTAKNLQRLSDTK
jgi:hypothetical protein